MKKTAALVAMSAVMAVSSSALAAEAITWSGDIAAKYQRNTQEGSDNTSGFLYTFRLKGEADLGSGWGLYARLGAQYAQNPSQADYKADDAAYGADKKFVATLDQFGVTYKQGNFDYKLGRQDVGVGALALLYSRPDTNIGHRAFVDGLTIAGKSGITDVNAVVAREDNSGKEDNGLYAVHIGLQPTERFNYGATVAHYDNKETGADATNHWAIDGGYKLGKHSWTAEYAQSDKSDDNKAYAVRWDYNFNDKTGLYVTAFEVQANADMGEQTDFAHNNRGFYYGVTHQLNKNDGIEVVYKDQKSLVDGEGKNSKLEATFKHSF